MRTMGNGRTTTHATPIRNTNELKTERPNSDVFVYTLSDEELAKYQAMEPPQKKQQPYIVWNAK